MILKKGLFILLENELLMKLVLFLGLIDINRVSCLIIPKFNNVALVESLVEVEMSSDNHSGLSKSLIANVNIPLSSSKHYF